MFLYQMTASALLSLPKSKTLHSTAHVPSRNLKVYVNLHHPQRRRAHKFAIHDISVKNQMHRQVADS